MTSTKNTLEKTLEGLLEQTLVKFLSDLIVEFVKAPEGVLEDTSKGDLIKILGEMFA